MATCLTQGPSAAPQPPLIACFVSPLSRSPPPQVAQTVRVSPLAAAAWTSARRARPTQQLPARRLRGESPQRARAQPRPSQRPPLSACRSAPPPRLTATAKATATTPPLRPQIATPRQQQARQSSNPRVPSRRRHFHRLWGRPRPRGAHSRRGRRCSRATPVQQSRSARPKQLHPPKPQSRRAWPCRSCGGSSPEGAPRTAKWRKQRRRCSRLRSATNSLQGATTPTTRASQSLPPALSPMQGLRLRPQRPGPRRRAAPPPGWPSRCCSAS